MADSNVKAIIEDIQGPAVPRPEGWETHPQVIEAHRLLFHAFLNNVGNFLLPEKLSGDGIVIVGGGSRYFGATWINAYILRKLGCELPIQVWYLGREELDFGMESMLNDLGAKCIDARVTLGNDPRILTGWHTKVWAIMRSGFENVLFLDADNTAVEDPTFLFSCPEFLEHGAILWPDLGYDIMPIAFKVCGLPKPTGLEKKPGHPTGYNTVESGQLLFNLPHSWKALCAARWMNDHSDFFYRRQEKGQRHPVWHFYGDKSTFLLGFESTKTSYFYRPQVDWFGTKDNGGFRQYDPQGRPLFEHHCMPTRKVRVIGDVVPEGKIRPDLYAQANQELRSKWSGCLWSWAGMSDSEKVIAKSWMGDYQGFGIPGLRSSIELASAGRVSGQPDFRWLVVTLDEQPTLFLHHGKEAVQIFTEIEDRPKHFVSLDRTKLLYPLPEKATPTDLFVWKSITVENEYRLPERFETGSVVLDIGGHKGFFAQECIYRGAGTVISVEPCLKNFVHLANKAIQGPPGIIPLHGAVYDGSDSWGFLNLSQYESNSGSPSIGVKDPTTTKCQHVYQYDLQALIDLTGPIDLMKLDCEGSEWVILDTYSYLISQWVNRICGEFHLLHVPREMYDSERNRLRDLLEDCGFTEIEIIPNPEADSYGWFFARRPQHPTTD